MNRVVEQTDTEKREMYMKLSKAELVNMLMENQRLLEMELNRKSNFDYQVIGVNPFVPPFELTNTPNVENLLFGIHTTTSNT